MSDLDSVIKKTLAQASPHSQSVFSQSPMTGEELLDFARASNLNVAATVKPDGGPHIATAGLVVVDNKLYMGADLETARYRNLRKNAGVALMILEGWKRQAILEGEARFLDMNGPKAQEVLHAQMKKLGWSTKSLFEILPRKIFTWKAPSKNRRTLRKNWTCSKPGNARLLAKIAQNKPGSHRRG